MLSRRAVLASALAVPPFSILRAQTRRKPNIIFILADDLGYGDLGCYGQKLIRTPHLDRMAGEGMRFTQAYAGSTVCAPSRCALMTGKHMGHARVRGNRKPELGLAPHDVTVAEILRGAGYRTGITGKWGLGGPETTGVPNQQGFDYFFGYLNQVHAHASYPTHLWENNREYFLTGNFGQRRTEFSNDLFTERALQFVEQNRERPFFLYLPYTIPHANNELTRETGAGMEVPDDAPYTGRDWKQVDRNFAASITRMDRDIGRLLAQLARLGLDENTLVLFSSDNGPHHEGGQTYDLFQSGGALRGIKRDLYEGGIRVPAIARWTGTIRPGQVSDAVWAFWDFLPAAADIAGVAVPAGGDGVSFGPALAGRPMPDRDYLYWEFHERGFDQAVRLGKWKGVRRGGRSSPVELYDLENDLGERMDVAAQNADVVGRIRRIMVEARTDSPEFPVREKVL